MAAALGKLDAFNLFDPNWNDAEYDIYYKMLNAGLRLPASTGSDWYISSANRVYAHSGVDFDYESWLQALKEGRTFITNGPALHLTVQGQEPGSSLEASVDEALAALVSWQSHYAVHRIELLFNGNVVASRSFEQGSHEGTMESDVPATADGWLAARLFSDTRDSFAQPIFAHTSPIYVTVGRAGEEKIAAAKWLDQSIERSLEWVSKKGRFYNDSQRAEVVDLFREGRQVFRAIAG